MFAQPVEIAGLLAVAISGVAAGQTLGLSCGTPEPTEEQLANTRALMSSVKTTFQSGRVAAQRNPIVVPTVFHVISSDNTTEGGYVASEVLDEQIDVLNLDYSPHGFSFDLKDVQYYVNAEWADDGFWPDIRGETRQGGYDTLNIWIQPSLGAGTVGFCTYPNPGINPGDSFILLDGCSILHQSLPGGSHPRFNLGKTAVHEVGHWLNVYHTFNGEPCSEENDFVDDTPAQAGPSEGCPIGRNSCPDLPGLDPIHNYMDYADDYCSEEFTAGQEARMLAAWNNWRSPS